LPVGKVRVIVEPVDSEWGLVEPSSPSDNERHLMMIKNLWRDVTYPIRAIISDTKRIDRELAERLNEILNERQRLKLNACSSSIRVWATLASKARSNFLVLSEIDAGKSLYVSYRSFPVSEPIEKVIDDVVSYEDDLYNHNVSVSLKSQIQDNLPNVWADKDRTYSVLFELVMNACRATSLKGNITISAIFVKQDNQPMVQISVSNPGRAIAADKRKRLFENFPCFCAIEHEKWRLDSIMSQG
jgi:signal transduction histidine kinase